MPTLISTDLQITGNIRTAGEVLFNGMINGDIVCGKLMIGHDASVIGEVEADEVIIYGRVTGRVSGKKVHLAKSARLVGGIRFGSLSIEAGAYLDGHCKCSNSVEGSQSAVAPTLHATTPGKAEAPPANTDTVPAKTTARN